jgi:hypothetical protein
MRSMRVRLWLMAAAGAALAGCATTKPQDAWTGGDPVRLSADEAACRQESAAIDPNAIAGYSDPRYGMTSAMAAAIAKDNPLADTGPQAHAAAFAACMNDKGWRQP